MVPSLVVNITDSCNFNCIYCPPYGENLCKGTVLYDEEAVCYAIDFMFKHGCKLIRFTGGEPLINPTRLNKFIKYANNRFNRTVINTNGALLENHFSWLEKYKDNLILKISLDSMDSVEAKSISKTDDLFKVLRNINQAIERNFHVELNTVLCGQNTSSVKSIIEFCRIQKINLKILTQSSFYGIIKKDTDTLSNDVIAFLNQELVVQQSERLASGMGASMIVYQNGQNKIYLIDHRKKDSLTPNKLFFDSCESGCGFFPCDTGVLSITISTDGLATPCRGRKDMGVNIFGLSKSEVNNKLEHTLNLFSNIRNINVNQLGG